MPCCIGPEGFVILSHLTVWFLVGNGGNDYGDYDWGLCRDYYRDPFPHSLLRTRHLNDHDAQFCTLQKTNLACELAAPAGPSPTPCVCVCVHTYIHTYILTYICIYICIHVCIYTYMHMYIYIYIYVRMCMCKCLDHPQNPTAGSRLAPAALDACHKLSARTSAESRVQGLVFGGEVLGFRVQGPGFRAAFP